MFIVKIGVLSLVAVCLSYCSGRTNAAEKSYPAVPCKWKGDMDMWWFTGQIH